MWKKGFNSTCFFVFLSLLGQNYAYSSSQSFYPIVEEISAFHYHTVGYDRNEDAYPDMWIRSSFRNQWIMKAFDHNFDHIIDATTERFRIKNLTRRIHLSKNKKTMDVVEYEFSERTYFFIDRDDDGTFDRFSVYNKKPRSRKLDLKISVKSQWDVDFLLKFLKKQELEGEISYVSFQMNEKYNLLQGLFESAQEDRNNIKKWGALLEKTREFLDLPSNEILPIKLRVAQNKEEIRGALGVVYGFNYLKFYPENFNHLRQWLRTIDHEVLHVVQYWQAYEEGREGREIFLKEHANFIEKFFMGDGLTWKAFLKRVHQERSEEDILKKIEEAPKKIESGVYNELECYLHGFYRQVLYNIVLDEEEVYKMLVSVGVHVRLIKKYNLAPYSFSPQSFSSLASLSYQEIKEYFKKYPDKINIFSEDNNRLLKFYEEGYLRR